MKSSDKQRSKEYQKIIEEEQTHWTQFDIDLVNCVRDMYPIIYTNIAGLTGYQRAGKIRRAWNEIGTKFKDLAVPDLKAKWKSLTNSYAETKLKYGSNIPETNKFHDGLLGFLDEFPKEENVKVTDQTQNSDGNITEDVDSEKKDYIKQLIHEEVDITDSELDIKEEVSDNDCAVKETDHAIDNSMAIEDVELDKDVKKWTEEELLNATRLTQEMIQELIHIKTKMYYSGPVDAVNNT